MLSRFLCTSVGCWKHRFHSYLVLKNNGYTIAVNNVEVNLAEFPSPPMLLQIVLNPNDRIEISYKLVTRKMYKIIANDSGHPFCCGQSLHEPMDLYHFMFIKQNHYDVVWILMRLIHPVLLTNVSEFFEDVIGVILMTYMLQNFAVLEIDLLGFILMRWYTYLGREQYIFVTISEWKSLLHIDCQGWISMKILLYLFAQAEIDVFYAYMGRKTISKSMQYRGRFQDASWRGHLLD